MNKDKEQKVVKEQVEKKSGKNGRPRWDMTRDRLRTEVKEVVQGGAKSKLEVVRAIAQKHEVSWLTVYKLLDRYGIGTPKGRRGRPKKKETVEFEVTQPNEQAQVEQEVVTTN